MQRCALWAGPLSEGFWTKIYIASPSGLRAPSASSAVVPHSSAVGGDGQQKRSFLTSPQQQGCQPCSDKHAADLAAAEPAPRLTASQALHSLQAASHAHVSSVCIPLPLLQGSFFNYGAATQRWVAREHRRQQSPLPA